MISAARQYDRVVQIGLQQRSWDHFQITDMVLGPETNEVTHVVAEKGLMSREEFDRLVERAAVEGNITPPRR